MAEKHSPIEMLGNITVDTDSAYDLGSSTLFWANAYIDKLFLLATKYIADESGEFVFRSDKVNARFRFIGDTATKYFEINTDEGAGKVFFNTDVAFLTSIAVNVNFIPTGDSSQNLGSSSLFWANAYIDKLITQDGTDNRYAFMMGT